MAKRIRTNPHGFIPVNKQSAVVISKVDEVDHSFQSGQMITSLERLPTTQYLGNPKHDMAGYTKGRLKVIGLFLKQSKASNAKWVVQCKCGYYEIRVYKSLTNPNNIDDCCCRCRQVKYLERRSEYLKTQ
mgnify:CR=1 FL=1